MMWATPSLLRRVGPGALVATSGALVWGGSALAEASPSEVPSAAPEARLRRATTTPARYTAGCDVRVVRVPQKLAGVDVGHISILVGNSDGTLASVGFYSEQYRSGLPLVTAHKGVLLTPDPLYARACADPRLRPRIVELFRGTLSNAQATALNQWTDDTAGALAITHITTSSGTQRELGVTPLDDERYVGLAAFAASAENCATWVERHFGCIRCTLGIPRFCRAVQADTRQADTPPADAPQAHSVVCGR